MSLDGMRVVVIGESSGIGFAVAELACEVGAEVVVASSGRATVDAAVLRLPGTAGRIVDLRDEAGVAGFFKELGGFDHLAITAGDWSGAMFARTAEIDLAQAREGLTIRSRSPANHRRCTTGQPRAPRGACPRSPTQARAEHPGRLGRHGGAEIRRGSGASRQNLARRLDKPAPSLRILSARPPAIAA